MVFVALAREVQNAECRVQSYKLMFIGVFARTKWREPYLVGRCLGAAENVRFIGCYGGSKPPPYGFVRKSNTPINQNLKDKLMFIEQ